MNWAFADCIEGFGPENFSTLQRCVKEELRAPSMPVVLALLRLSRCDADVYYKFRQTLLDKVMYSSPSENSLADLVQDISGVRSSPPPGSSVLFVHLVSDATLCCYTCGGNR